MKKKKAESYSPLSRIWGILEEWEPEGPNLVRARPSSTELPVQLGGGAGGGGGERHG